MADITFTPQGNHLADDADQDDYATESRTYTEGEFLVLVRGTRADSTAPTTPTLTLPDGLTLMNGGAAIANVLRTSGTTRARLLVFVMTGSGTGTIGIAWGESSGTTGCACAVFQLGGDYDATTPWVQTKGGNGSSANPQVTFDAAFGAASNASFFWASWSLSTVTMTAEPDGHTALTGWTAAWPGDGSYKIGGDAGLNPVATISSSRDWVAVGIEVAASGDTQEPTLSSPTGAESGSATADGTVDTDEGNGTLYWVVTQSATDPSVAQVQAGQDHTGAAADADGSQAVSGTGTQNVEAAGLVPGTTYYFHYQHQDAATNDSTVASSASFTTDAACAVTGTATASINENDVVAGGKTIVLTLTGDTYLAADTGPIGTTANSEALVDGIDSAQSEATGWDAKVKAAIKADLATYLVRTSDTVATITPPVVADYDITARETITTTIPAAVLTGGEAIVASSTFTVDPVGSAGAVLQQLMAG